ncbi:hypothetical protein IWQ56_003721 [Coemansia nantahalensis]|nr:hypothetical protein IWQ56_003721 [Coemansia nantahalensis]
MPSGNAVTIVPPQVDVCEEELADYTSHLEKIEATPENAKLRDLLADAVAAGRRVIDISPPGTDLPETGFLRQVFNTLCPRVCTRLGTTPGMVNVAASVLAVTVDPDIGTLSISGRCGQSDLTMIIEVVRAFPMVDARPTLPTIPHGDEVPGSGFLGVLEFRGKWFDPEALREALNRTASRMDTNRPPTTIGALVSKQAVIELFLTRGQIMLSHPFEYSGTSIHPVTALAYPFKLAAEDPRLENVSISQGYVSLGRQ